MRKEKLLALLLIMIMAVMAVVNTSCSATEGSNSAGQESAAEKSGDDTSQDQAVGGDNSRGAGKEGDRTAAEGLIDKDVTMDDIVEAVGEYGDFEMSSKGCERGVYAGLFFYDNFILHSRTYDKGQTFHVTAVNDY